MSLNPLESCQTLTSYMVQVMLGDTPAGTLEYHTIFAVGLTLFLLTLICAQSVIFGLRYLRRSRVWSRLSLRLERLRRERNTARIEAAWTIGAARVTGLVAACGMIEVRGIGDSLDVVVSAYAPKPKRT
jgi:hypothetical protein